MPRFVILEHDHPVLHWDLMLEAGDVLWTWRLPVAPTAGGDAMMAERLPDHRRAYLDYEGPVSGGRGTVKRWDAGAVALTSTSDELRLRLEGQRLAGAVILKKLADDHW